MLAKQIDGGQGFERRHIAAARHDHVGFPTLIVTGPLPDAQTDCTGATAASISSHCGVGLLTDHDNIHVVPAAQAMIRYRQQDQLASGGR